ncbi:hypothetical protein [Ornithinibacillus xuwenensis]|uniref:Permease n=1 Tax=Ornithinibacillus xuwenensis TaxID=3144668 RepID=A0ABU9XGW7_9BACI
MVLRKFFGFVFTTLLIGSFLNYYIVITEDIDNLFSTFGIILTATFPFILLIGVPVSVFSDYRTKNLNGKQRYTKAFLTHIILGLIAGVVISYFLESKFLIVVTLLAAFIFWLGDEILRGIVKGTND